MSSSDHGDSGVGMVILCTIISCAAMTAVTGGWVHWIFAIVGIFLGLMFVSQIK